MTGLLLLLATTAKLLGRHEGAARLHALHAERIEPLQRLKDTGDPGFDQAFARQVEAAAKDDAAAYRAALVRNLLIFGVVLVAVTSWPHTSRTSPRASSWPDAAQAAR